MFLKLNMSDYESKIKKMTETIIEAYANEHKNNLLKLTVSCENKDDILNIIIGTKK